MTSPNRPLSEEERKRLERKARTLKNRRGRRNPAVMPNRLARTSAFAPRRRDLITDSTFHRIYEVSGYSVLEVKGRELGSQHRDAIYALFRLPQTLVRVPNPNYRPNTFQPISLAFYETRTTWRQLLKATGRTEHVNNAMSLLNVFEEIKQVVLTIHEGRSIEEMEKIYAKKAKGQLPDVPGAVGSIVEELSWSGAKLDSEVVVRFGTRVRDMIEKSHLVSINADVHFRLKGDYAKTFWPFIDSQTAHTFVDEDRLAQLAGRKIWEGDENSRTRAQFRKECRQAFKDMVDAGGLKDWREEVTGSGWSKSRRYHYTHALPTQGELDLRPVEAKGSQAPEITVTDPETTPQNQPA